MWCIGRITAEYRERMYDLLGLYAKAYDATEPVICLDEKSKQLLEQTRRPLPTSAGQSIWWRSSMLQPVRSIWFWTI